MIKFKEKNTIDTSKVAMLKYEQKRKKRRNTKNGKRKQKRWYCKRERERERELKSRKSKKIETQKSCVCLGYKDGLRKLVCLFYVCDSS